VRRRLQRGESHPAARSRIVTTPQPSYLDGADQSRRFPEKRGEKPRTYGLTSQAIYCLQPFGEIPPTPEELDLTDTSVHMADGAARSIDVACKSSAS
jgi:hypothetical protein